MLYSILKNPGTGRKHGVIATNLDLRIVPMPSHARAQANARLYMERQAMLESQLAYRESGARCSYRRWKELQDREGTVPAGHVAALKNARLEKIRKRRELTAQLVAALKELA